MRFNPETGGMSLSDGEVRAGRDRSNLRSEETRRDVSQVRKTAALTLGAILGAASIIALSGSAQADPDNCQTIVYNYGRSAAAICNDGTGKYRVKTSCWHSNWQRRDNLSGPERRVGQYSIYTCPAEWTVVPGSVTWVVTEH
ncbi:hypothetical protein ACIBEJ_51475 [Nonomuraea sp. NPDC050790]|uniref:hypothetical protein n=1 Tax=Nonomuraea sp. NPDC050790 TaxID=3364371 RepID=UPI00378F7DB6